MRSGILYAGAKEPELLLDELAARMEMPVRYTTHTEFLREFRSLAPRLVVADCDAGPEELYRDIREVRSLSRVPLLALVSDPRTATEALELGADSAAPTPLDVEELTLRIEAILRRVEAFDPDSVYRDAQVEFDSLRHRVRVRGHELRLTPTEFRMFEALVARPGIVLRHEDLIEATWGDCFHARAEVKLYISYLRRKLAAAGIDPIETVRGIGYRYVPRPLDRVGTARS